MAKVACSDAELKRLQRKESRHLFNKKLIAEVRRRPILWKHDEKFFGVKGSLDGWNELGDQFGVSGVAVRQRWRNIRDGFTRLWRNSFGKRKVDFATAKALAGSVKWPYFKELLFLFEPAKGSAAEARGEEAANDSASPDAVNQSVEETDDTTGSGDFEPSNLSESLDAFEASCGANASDPVEPSDAIMALADKMTNGRATSDAGDISAGEEETAACAGDSASTGTLRQLPVENATTPATGSIPITELFPVFAKGKNFAPKGLVVSDVRSMRDTSGAPRPTSTPSQQVGRPSLPVSGLSPRTAEVSKSPASQVAQSSATPPKQMDHISHFLCSLDRYVRKTADNIQPQLMMELLNVASSYSENVYPRLLFPRT